MFSTPGPLLHFPTTPKSHSHHPLSSSPLSAVSPSPSPTTKAQARRRSQYKSTAPLPSSSTAPRRSSVAYTSNRRRSSPADATSFVRGNLFGPPTTEKKTDEETPRNVLLRDRFRQRCFERAQRARESKIRKGRKFSASSDDGDMDMDDEDDDGEVDAFLDDEIYRRIIMSTQRKREHAYRVSYQHDVGSSFDPDMEDPVEWEQDLRDEAPLPPLPGPMPPSDFDDDEAAELAALAEDEAYWDALHADDSDPQGDGGVNSYQDDDMDMS